MISMIIDLHNLLTTKTIAIGCVIWIIGKRIYQYVNKKVNK